MPVRKNTSRIKTVSIAADNYACVRSVVWRLPQAGSPKPASTSKGTEMSATAAARPVEPEVRSDTSPSDVAALGRSSRVLLTGVAMAIPQDLPFDEWVRAGRRLSGIVDSSSWWLGDWLVHGKRHFADRYEVAIRTAGLRYQTLRNYAWVCRRFDIERRRAGLTFQHHAEVASLPQDDQDRWLNAAEQGKWSTKQLRTRLQAGGVARSATPPGPRPVAMPRIEVADGRLGWWRSAADQAGVPFNMWVTLILDRAADDVLG